MLKKLSYSVYRSLRKQLDVLSIGAKSSASQFGSKLSKRTFSLVLPHETTPLRLVPDFIQKPPYAETGHVAAKKIGEEIEIKSDEQISGMRKAGKMARKILNQASDGLQIGMTTDDIDAIVHQLCIENQVYPSPLNYKHFPKSVCTSVNNVTCHGVPDLRPLANGDIINIDITVFCGGYHGDVSETYMIGDVDDEAKRLIHATRMARDVAISQCKAGVKYSKIGHTISSIADMYGYKVVPAFCGHGIGDYFHGPPDVFHFENSYDDVIQDGVTFTIEPILSEGTDEIYILSDGWTAVTYDGSRTAQFEHTILVTRTGPEILTE